MLVEPLINHACIGRQLVEFDSDGGNNEVTVAACLSSCVLALASAPLFLGGENLQASPNAHSPLCFQSLQTLTSD